MVPAAINNNDTTAICSYRMGGGIGHASYSRCLLTNNNQWVDSFENIVMHDK
jgi:hypothetical protein